MTRVTLQPGGAGYKMTCHFQGSMQRGEEGWGKRRGGGVPRWVILCLDKRRRTSPNGTSWVLRNLGVVERVTDDLVIRLECGAVGSGPSW